MSDDSNSSESTSEDDLVVRAKTDRAAFGCLFDCYYPQVLRYCLRRLSERATAEDVTSEVFLNVASHLRDFPGERGTDFRRWLFRIATNSIHAHLRQTNRRRALLQTAARGGRLGGSVEGSSAVANSDALDWPTVRVALLELDEREQAIVTLRFFADLSHEEIAGVLDSTPGAVRTALSRALARLRKKLDPSRPPRREE
jgi:RNA polymerase sigma-70 factor (ECF subfamily)